MQIYLARNNQQAGPYTVEQLNQMLNAQQVLLTDLIWHQGMSEWKMLGELTQGELSYTPAGYQASTTNEVPNSVQDSIQMSQPKTNTALSLEKNKETAQLAPLSKRFFAKVIDLSLWIPVSLLPTALLNPEQRAEIAQLQAQIFSQLSQDNLMMANELSEKMIQVVPSSIWLVVIAYIILMLAGQAFLLFKTGQSVGKKVLNLHIVDADSQQMVGITRSFLLRTILTIIMIYIFFPFAVIDWLFGFSKKRQTLHDRLAKTVVIEKNK